MTPERCDNVSPQCPRGQEAGYRLGWYQGQVDACDRYYGTPCEQIRHEQAIDALLEERSKLIATLRQLELHLPNGVMRDLVLKALK